MNSNPAQRSQPDAANQPTASAEQPEEGTPRSSEEKQIRKRSDLGSERVEQGAGDDVGEATEEA